MRPRIRKFLHSIASPLNSKKLELSDHLIQYSDQEIFKIIKHHNVQTQKLLLVRFYMGMVIVITTQIKAIAAVIYDYWTPLKFE